MAWGQPHGDPADARLERSVVAGKGFRPHDTSEGVGISRSIRARIGEVGGPAEIDGNPGRGTEVRHWVPT